MSRVTGVFCIALLFLVSEGSCGSVNPAAIGEAVYNAGVGLNQVSEAWLRFSTHVNGHAALKKALRNLKILPVQAARIAHRLVDRIRVGDAPSVKTALGVLRGRAITTKMQPRKQYYSFKGIRYAQPPISSFRFKAPRPVEAWEGTRDALEEGSVCPHKFVLFDTYKGEEDCLFLNVYTPELPDKISGTNPQLPVMVWLHGGGFAMGSGNSFFYGPDYLVSEDVVVVTLNYRLGSLGYLSLENEEAPGNAGLKDQLLALKWIKQNIEFFGGDPNMVTIFGTSAGGAAVQYLMVSPLAQGLFHRAISQSGWSLSPWALAEKPAERAFSLGKALGKVTTNKNELLAFLQSIRAETLTVAATKTLTKEDARKNIGIPFVPVVEPYFENGKGETLIDRHPRESLATGLFAKVPYMTGYNSHEGLLFIRRLRKDPTILDQVENDFKRMVPQDLIIPGGVEGPVGTEVADRIRRFYIQDRAVNMETLPDMILLMTDIMFLRPALTSIRLQKTSAPDVPIYFYRFAYDGALGLFKRFLGINRPGTCHGDEMGYLFKFGGLNIRLDEDSTELMVKKRMVKMWTNFAKYGNPTPDRTDRILDFNWDPISATNLTNVNYLDITSEFTPSVAPEKDRMAFWDQLYKEFNNENWDYQTSN